MSNANKTSMLFLILIVIPFGGIGIDLYAASMPQLATYLKVDASLIQMTLSVFLIGLFILDFRNFLI